MKTAFGRPTHDSRPTTHELRPLAYANGKQWMKDMDGRCLYDTNGFGCACSRSEHHGHPCPGPCEWFRTEVVMDPTVFSRWVELAPDKENDDEA